MMKGFRVMLVPNKKQETRLFQYAGAARFAYNWALEKQMDSFQEGKGFIQERDLRKELTILKKQPEKEWMNTISNDVLKQAVKDLDQAYKRFFKEKKKPGYQPYSKKFLTHMEQIGKKPSYYQSRGHPKFKKKKDLSRYGFYQDTAKVKITDTHVFLEGLSKSKRKNRLKQNWVLLAEKGYIPVGVKYQNPRITFDGLHWYLSVSVEVPSQREAIQPETDGIGIDLGVKEAAVCSDGRVYHNVNRTSKVKRLEKRKKRLQRSIARKYKINKKGESYCKTANIRKAETKLRKLDKRLKDIRHDNVLQIASKITDRKPMFVILENLNVKGMLLNKHLARSIQEQTFRETRKWMEWECQKKQIPVVIADQWFASSKLCSHCGHKKTDLKLKDRIYRCDKCGYQSDRDFNASLNLKQYGLEHLYA